MSKTTYQKEYRKRYREARIHKYHNMTDEQKQKYKDYQKKIKENMTDEKKPKI